MKYDFGIDVKSVIFGAAIAAAFILFGYQYWDWFYPFSALGLLYVGYCAKNIKYGAVLGAFAATPIVVLTFQGYMGTFSGFFLTQNGILLLTALILIVGAFVGAVGALTKQNRLKAIEEYEKQQKIGKNKTKKNKTKKAQPKSGFLSKFKK